MQALDNLKTNQVKNIYVYVADDVRYDFLPNEIADLGVSIKLICDGQISPTSFSSIVTGLHYPQHGVYSFEQRVPESAPNLLHSPSHTTNFCNTINPPPFNTNPNTESILMNTLRTDDSPSDTIETVSPPFVVVERGPGGHAPYGSFDGNATEYFRKRINAPYHQITNEYKSGVKRDSECFQSRLNTLEDRGLTDETLVIYASDHGELLGEEGNIGHNAVMHRKLVEAPCVFIHPSLPTTDIRHKIIRHVDLLPTIQAAGGITVPSKYDLPGTNLLDQSAPKCGTSYYRTEKHTGTYFPSINLEYESVWDVSGGYIIPTSTRIERAAIGARSMLFGPKANFRRRQPAALMSGFLKETHRSGVPGFSLDLAKDILEKIRCKQSPSPSNRSLNVQTERLKELGYLE